MKFNRCQAAAHTMKLSLALLTLVLATMGCHRRGVSLTMTDASAKQESDYLDVRCVAVLDNQTGSSLVVTSIMFSAFSSLRIVVSAADGTRLAEQTYGLHMSPSFDPGRAFVFPPGVTTQLMAIPVGLTNAPATVSLQLTGALWQSSYTGTLVSPKIDVAVRRP